MGTGSRSFRKRKSVRINASNYTHALPYLHIYDNFTPVTSHPHLRTCVSTRVSFHPYLHTSISTPVPLHAYLHTCISTPLSLHLYLHTCLHTRIFHLYIHTCINSVKWFMRLQARKRERRTRGKSQALEQARFASHCIYSDELLTLCHGASYTKHFVYHLLALSILKHSCCIGSPSPSIMTDYPTLFQCPPTSPSYLALPTKLCKFSCDSGKYRLKSIAKMSLRTLSGYYNWLLSRCYGSRWLSM